MIDLKKYSYEKDKIHNLKELQEESKSIQLDILKAFTFDYYSNSFTGFQNVTGTKNKPLSLIVRLVNEQYFNNSISFYDKNSFLVAHRKYSSMFAIHKNRITFIMQNNEDKNYIFVIKNGSLLNKKIYKYKISTKDLKLFVDNYFNM